MAPEFRPEKSVPDIVDIRPEEFALLFSERDEVCEGQNGDGHKGTGKNIRKIVTDHPHPPPPVLLEEPPSPPRFSHVVRVRETLCESGRCNGALETRRRAKKRWRVLKKSGTVLKKRGRVLKKVCLVMGTGGGPLLQKGGGGFLRRGGRVLKNLVKALKEFDPLPPTLSVSLTVRRRVWRGNCMGR